MGPLQAENSAQPRLESQRPMNAKLESGMDMQLYMLAIVDESTGVPVRPVTDEDLAGIPAAAGGCNMENRIKAGREEGDEEEPTRVKTIQEMVEEARRGDGPVCDNCGVTGERARPGLGLGCGG